MSKLHETQTPFTHAPQEVAMETTIRKIGNGAFLPLTGAVRQALGLEIGQAVRVTVKDGVLTMAPADGTYARTREAAAAARGRYPRALDILGQ
jgi:antitoxin component of MazEF toxin-antitoxin module